MRGSSPATADASEYEPGGGPPAADGGAGDAHAPANADAAAEAPSPMLASPEPATDAQTLAVDGPPMGGHTDDAGAVPAAPDSGASRAPSASAGDGAGGGCRISGLAAADGGGGPGPLAAVALLVGCTAARRRRSPQAPPPPQGEPI